MTECLFDCGQHCVRCLVRQNRYSDQQMCYSCTALYSTVYTEVLDEYTELRRKAATFQRYVGDCRPWRAAADLALPLLMLNRLALDVGLFPPGDPAVRPTYNFRISGTITQGTASSGREPSPPSGSLWAGNMEMLLASWPLSANALKRGMDHLDECGMIEYCGQSPYDSEIELWMVTAPYRIPNLNAVLADAKAGSETGTPKRRTKRTTSRRRSPVPV